MERGNVRGCAATWEDILCARAHAVAGCTGPAGEAHPCGRNRRWSFQRP